MKNQKGFTLIELMIVVAIIGILAAIAIPNFLKFQAKSKQSEAKTNLKGLYTAETSFFGESNKYDTIIKVNWVPVGRTFLYGYTLDGALAATDGLHAGLAALPAGAAAINWAGAVVALSDTGFTAGAAGVISSKNVPDCWTINDKNYLNPAQDGI
jgi:type IV pilus assembly protein PilA